MAQNFLRIAKNLLPTYVKNTWQIFWASLKIFTKSGIARNCRNLNIKYSFLFLKIVLYMFSIHIDHEKYESDKKFSLDPLEFHNSGIHGIAGIGIWNTTFCRKKACLYMLSTHIDHEKHEFNVEF